MIETTFNWTDHEGFNFCLLVMITSCLVLGLGFFVSKLLHQASAASRFGVWQATFVGLLAIPLAAWLAPEIPLGWSINSPATNVTTASQLSPNTESIASNAYRQTPIVPMGIIHQGSAADSFSVESAANQLALTDSQTHANLNPGILADASTAWPTKELTTAPVTWRSVLVLIWVLGFVVSLARMISTCFRARGIIRRARPTTIEGVPTHASTPLLISEEIEIPVTAGLFKPKIILPVTSTQWTAERTRLVLLHEQAHVERRDILWQSLTRFIAALYWFQPLVWLGESQMKLERERACDDQVLRKGETASDYAQVLLEFAAELGGKTPNLFGALSMAQKPIEKRMTMILDPKTNRSDSAASTRAGLVLVFLAFATFSSAVRPWSPVPASASDPIRAAAIEPGSGKPVIASQNEAINKTEVSDDKIALPDFLTGKVIDENKNPVANAIVELRSISSEDHIGFHNANIVTLKTVKTNKDGKYDLETGGLIVNAKRSLIMGYISKQGYLDSNCYFCLLYTSPSPRDRQKSRMPSSA